jgi:hypothetical protein
LGRRFAGHVLLSLTEELGNLTDFSLHACGDDDSRSTAAGDGATRVDEVGAVTDGHVRIGEDGIGLLADGNRFTGEERLIRGQVNSLDQTQVGGDDITGGEDDDVALDQGLSLDGVTDATTDDLALGCGQSIERLDGLLGTVVLD